jgi:hypothetical protein
MDNLRRTLMWQLSLWKLTGKPAFLYLLNLMLITSALGCYHFCLASPMLIYQLA